VALAPDYEVSSEGRVRSASGELPQRPDRDGYMRVDLAVGGGRVTVPVHQLVLETFVGPPPEDLIARHLDNDPANPSLANLAWGSREQNEKDKVFQGTRAAPPEPPEDPAMYSTAVRRHTTKLPSRVKGMLGEGGPRDRLVTSLRER